MHTLDGMGLAAPSIGDNCTPPSVNSSDQEITTMWIKPDYTELRFGFEVTMYIANR